MQQVHIYCSVSLTFLPVSYSETLYVYSLYILLFFPLLRSKVVGYCLNLCMNGLPLVEQELPTLPEHMISPPGFSGIHVTQSLVMFCRSLFVLFLLAIVFSVLRFQDSDYLFGILKLLLNYVTYCVHVSC